MRPGITVFDLRSITVWFAFAAVYPFTTETILFPYIVTVCFVRTFPLCVSISLPQCNSMVSCAKELIYKQSARMSSAAFFMSGFIFSSYLLLPNASSFLIQHSQVYI